MENICELLVVFFPYASILRKNIKIDYSVMNLHWKYFESNAATVLELNFKEFESSLQKVTHNYDTLLIWYKLSIWYIINKMKTEHWNFSYISHNSVSYGWSQS